MVRKVNEFASVRHSDHEVTKSGMAIVKEGWKGRAPMTLTKAQIAEMIAEQNGFAKSKSVEVVEKLIELIKQTLQSGEDVLVSGFGKFWVNLHKGTKRDITNSFGIKAYSLDMRTLKSVHSRRF